MGIGKWNAKKVVDTNANGTTYKVEVHVEEAMTAAEYASLVLRASSPYTQANFDDYAAGIFGSWWDDLPQAVRVFFRTSFAT